MPRPTALLAFAAVALLLSLSLATAAGAAPPARRSVRFTAGFELTKRFETRLVPQESLVGCVWQEGLLPLDGTTSEHVAISATGSLDYAVQSFGIGPPLVQGPALNPHKGEHSVKATFAIERSASVLRPAPCDDDATETDRNAQPVPYPMPCAARATERPPGRVEISLVRNGRWAIHLPGPRLCNGEPAGDDALFPSTAPAPTFKLPKLDQLTRRRRTVVPVAGRGDCSTPSDGHYRQDCTVTIGGTLTLTRRR